MLARERDKRDRKREGVERKKDANETRHKERERVKMREMEI
jgi:hypothetical protein